MKNTLLILFFSFILFGCTSNTNDSHKEYSFTENSRIALDNQEPHPFIKIESGENLVFKYYFQKEDNENISDDEYSEAIFFEIDSDVDHFSYTNEELASINTYFDKYCFCIREGSTPIIEGIIKGNKIENLSWDIEIDISFIDNNKKTSRKIKATFLSDTRHSI